MKNPYRAWVQQLVRHQTKGATLPLGGLPTPRRPQLKARAPKVLLFSPHPDDECIVGGLALRLLREQRMNVINIAVTLGSNVARRAERRNELAAACDYLGFGLELAGGDGLENVNANTRSTQPAAWAAKTKIVADVLLRHQPRLVLVPHEADGHPTHVGTHLLVMDALRSLPEFTCTVVETEFWAPLAAPNVMVEIPPREVADLVAALSCHVGEVQRNPYHLRLPAWMQDNVRRGSERMLGCGEVAPAITFAVMYRVLRWNGQGLQSPWEVGIVIGVNNISSVAELPHPDVTCVK